jgi:hypothetical protein
MQNASEPRPSCLARLLDVRGYVLAARRAMLNAEPAAALAMAAGFGLIALCLLPLWISYDLASTWSFTTALRDGSAMVVEDAAARAGGFLGMSVAALLAGVVLTSYTLLPSLFELVFPAVAHPLLSLVLWASIIFDYTTDWGASWEVTAQWAGPDSPLVHWIYAVLFCLFVSIGVQALLVICITVVCFAVFALLTGGARQARVIIEQ